jgi:hypothetical protein
MRFLAGGIFLTLLLAGCAAPQPKPVGDLPPPTKAKSAKQNPKSALLVTPNPVLTGHVVSFNATGRFVVLNFPVGHLPALEQRLALFRQGVKVGEVKVTGPQRDDHVVADVTEGEARAGDEVRER